MAFIRSISGLRATLSDNSLDDQAVIRYANAFAAFLPNGEIVIGRDGRPSGENIEKIIAETLKKQGRNVRLLGIVPTPTVQLETEHSDAAGAIAITASHNPDDWNGMKFINSNGVFLNLEENIAFWQIVDNSTFTVSSHIGEIISDTSAIDNHLRSIINIPFIADNIDLIKQMNLKVAVDAVNASGSVAVPKLLEALNCKVVDLYCSGSGVFPHEPEPLPKNLTQLAQTVRSEKCDLGVAVDPDADRLVLIDENGNTISEEMTLALAVDSTLMNFGKPANVVINLSSSKISEEIAKKYDSDVFRSAVGEINVVSKMKEVGAVIGGEGSGGVILPQCHYGRDSLVGIALVLLLIAKKNQPISEIIDEYPKFAMKKHKLDFSGDFEQFKVDLANQFPNASIDYCDGIRIDFDDYWLQARLSNTEPIIRIIAESRDEEFSNQLVSKASMLL